MFDLVIEIRNLISVMKDIENDLKNLNKQGKPEEKNNGGAKK